jgi:hypothetical protein
MVCRRPAPGPSASSKALVWPRLLAAGLLVACQKDEVRRSESQATGCPQASIEVGAACEADHYRVINGCDRAVRFYHCSRELPFSFSRCERQTPSCAASTNVPP